MSPLRKPFRAVPVKLGPYHRREQRRANARAALRTLAAAALLGGGAGVASVVLSPAASGLRAQARTLAVAGGPARARPPMAGDYWGGCNDARAAGTAPIYAGEPGYREDMDGDDDGIACEVPHA